MTMAGTFTGALSLICQMQPIASVRPEPVTISIRDGAAEISGLDDASVQHGLIAYRGSRGALRLVAITLREPERDIWAELRPQSGGGYALAFHSAPHGTPRPSEVWARGQCAVGNPGRHANR